MGEAGNYDLLLGRFHAKCSRASPDEHMSRVRVQDDEPAMADNPKTMVESYRILEARDWLYAQAEGHLFASGKSVAESTVSLPVVIDALLGKTLFS